MPGVTGILEVAKVNIGDPTVGVHHHTNTDVSVFLVFSVQSISNNIVTGLLMQGTHTQHLVGS